MTSASRTVVGTTVRWFAVSTFVAVAAAILLKILVPLPEPPPAEVVGVVAPRHVSAGERFATYLGATGRPGDARIAIRVCSAASCPVDRVQPLTFERGTELDVVWSWIASTQLPAGEYRATAYLQRPTPFGPRTVDVAYWTVEATP